MLINCIKLENWKSIDKIEKKFTEGVNLIEGNNYSGKTSIIQGLFFGLFNDTMYKKQLKPDHLKQEGKKEGMVEIDFTLDGSDYRIRRFITGTTRISVNSHLYELDDKGEEVNELESVSRKSEYLQKLQDHIFKASREYLKNINFIQEGSIYNFMVDPAFTINKDLNQILRLDDLTEISEFCDKGIKALDNKIDDLEDKKDEYEDLYTKSLEKREKLEDKLQNKKEEREKIEKKIADQEKTIELLQELK
ncbi:MAG: AAA family ATPase, partial [Promethearchaeia archaeon]